MPRRRPQLCRSGGLLGWDADGVFAGLVAVDEACLHPLPAGLPAPGAALFQALASCGQPGQLKVVLDVAGRG